MAFNPLQENRHGTDYRLETEEPPPLEELRARDRAPAGAISPAGTQTIGA